MPADSATHIDWGQISGWVAAISVVVAWVARAVGVVNRVKEVEATLKAETTIIKAEQAAQRTLIEEFGDRLTTLSDRLFAHVEKGNERGGP